jgi:hypothetical protein
MKGVASTGVTNITIRAGVTDIFNDNAGTQGQQMEGHIGSFLDENRAG